MKKNLFGWLAMATMLVGTGCSSDEVVNDYSPENAIQFGTYVGRDAQSRATSTTSDNIANFGVFAYYTGQTPFATALSNISNTSNGGTIATPNFMYNQLVSRNTSETVPGSAVISGWNYSPLKYWPNNNGDKITFFAYSPYDANCAKNGTQNSIQSGLPSVTFTVNNTVKDQQDLLWAIPMIDKTKQKVEENVQFTFNHALSRIGFDVQAMVDKVNEDKEKTDQEPNNGNVDDAVGNGDILKSETTILVKEVILKGKFIPSGSLTYTKVVATANAAETYTAAINGNAATNDIEYKLSATAENNSNFKTTITSNLGRDATAYSQIGQIVTNDEAQLNADDSYIMIIPKDFTNEDLTIQVKYDVLTVDSKLESGYSKVENTISSKFRGVNFVAGNAYTFSLHLGLTSVKLSAIVNPWQNSTDYVVNVPINTTTTTTTTP